MKAGKIDLEYLGRFTNASVLVNEDPKSEQFGLFLRDADGQPQVIDRNTGELAAWNGKGVEPDLSATHRHKGVTHRPVFHQMADRYMADSYSPEAVEDRCGIPAKRIRAIAADLAALEEKLQEQGAPWTPGRIPDWP